LKPFRKIAESIIAFYVVPTEITEKSVART